MSLATIAFPAAMYSKSFVGEPKKSVWPTIGVVDEVGARFVPDDEIAPVVEAILASRVDNPGGAR